MGHANSYTCTIGRLFLIGGGRVMPDSNEDFSLAQWLGEELKRRQKRRELYSRRAFARTLGMSPGALSEILAGKRFLARPTAERLLTRLGYPPAEHLPLLQRIENERLIKRIGNKIAACERDASKTSTQVRQRLAARFADAHHKLA